MTYTATRHRLYKVNVLKPENCVTNNFQFSTSCHWPRLISEMICPDIDSEDIHFIIKKYYGLVVKNCKEFNSYDDKNFYVEVEKESDNPFITNVSANGYVFKVLNSEDSQWPELVEGQTLMMNFLKSKDFAVTTTIKNKEGNFLTIGSFPMQVTNEEPNHPKHIMRLLNYLPGILINDIDLTSNLLYDLGVFVGKLSNSLKGFTNESILKREYLWTLSSVPELKNYLSAIKEPSKVALIRDVLASWENVVVPVLPLLEKGIIHGDLNEQNILVEPDASSNYRISGLLDFGDVSCSCYVFELAITLTYMIMKSKNMDLIDVPGHLLAGYLTQREVTEEEWCVLKECIACRFAQSLVLGAYSFSLNPKNTYLLTTSKNWDKLEKLCAVPKEELILKWKKIASNR